MEMNESRLWKMLKHDTVINDGPAHEFWFAYVATGEHREKLAAQDHADIIVKNANGAVVATVESKTGCGPFDDVHDLEHFVRMPHCTHVAYNPRYNSPERSAITVVLPYPTFIKLVLKYRLIRNVPKGSKRAKGQNKTGWANYLPQSTSAKGWDGLTRGHGFLEELYAAGETVEEFLTRVKAVKYLGD